MYSIHTEPIIVSEEFTLNELKIGYVISQKQILKKTHTKSKNRVTIS